MKKSVTPLKKRKKDGVKDFIWNGYELEHLEREKRGWEGELGVRVRDLGGERKGYIERERV